MGLAIYDALNAASACVPYFSLYNANVTLADVDAATIAEDTEAAAAAAGASCANLDSSSSSSSSAAASSAAAVSYAAYTALVALYPKQKEQFDDAMNELETYGGCPCTRVQRASGSSSDGIVQIRPLTFCRLLSALLVPL